MTNATSPTPEFTHVVDLSTLADGGRSLHLQADDATRQALAARLGLLALPALEAQIRLTRRPDGLVHAGGTITAEVTQSCIVTLVPVTQHLLEEIDELFVPPVAHERWIAEGGLMDPELVDTEILDPFALAEPLDSDLLDIGEVVAQLLSLALDPYPRAPGAQNTIGESLDGDAEEAIEPPAGPFAILEKFRSQQ